MSMVSIHHSLVIPVQDNCRTAGMADPTPDIDGFKLLDRKAKVIRDLHHVSIDLNERPAAAWTTEPHWIRWFNELAVDLDEPS